MPALARYTIDLSVLFGIVFTLWLQMSDPLPDYSENDYREYDRAVKQFVWDSYGPGAHRLYHQFRAQELPPARISTDFQKLLDIVNLIGCSEGSTIAPAFNSDYQMTWFQINFHFEKYLQFVEKTGPYLDVPVGIQECVSEEPESLPLFAQWHDYNFPTWIDPDIARVERLRAKHDWQIGNYNEAVDRLDRLIRIVRAFRYNLDVRTETHRGIREVLAIPEDLVWHTPDRTADRTMVDGLERIRSYSWEAPLHFGLYHYYQDSMDKNKSFEETILRDEYQHALDIASTELERLNSTPTAELIKSRNLVNSSSGFSLFAGNRYDRSQIQLCQWTGLLALRRRAAHLPDKYYQSDPILPIAVAKKLPPLIYLNSRRAQESVWPVTEKLIPDKIDLLLAVYKARLWRDEKGTWPTPEEFKQLLPEGSNLEWRIESDPQPFVIQFANDHRLFPTYAKSYLEFDLAEQDELPFGERLPQPLRWDAEYPNRLTYIFPSSLVWDDTRDGELPPEIQRNHELMFNCVPALFESLQPLVKSTHWRVPEDELLPGAIVNVLDSSFSLLDRQESRLHVPADAERIDKKLVEYVVEFNLPELSYWVVHPKAKESDITSPNYKNDMILLAGWE